MVNSSTDFFTQHEIRINKIVSKIYLGLCSIPLLILVMTVLGYYNYPLKQGVFAIVVALILGVFLIVYNKSGILPRAFKYIMLAAIQFIIFLYSCDVNIQITSLYMLAPMLAVLYFNPKLTAFACLISIISMITGIVMSADQAVEILWRGISPTQYIFTTGSGRLIEMIGASAVFISTSTIARNMLRSLKHRNQKITSMQTGLVYSFADMIESRDGTTGEHVKRTSQTVDYITKYIMSNPEVFSYNLSKQDCELISMAAPLHDIGKMKVPDSILSKPGKLTPDEYDIIKTHPGEGAKIIDRTMAKIEDAVYIKFAREMALCHHEKWNGEGYPHGLKGEEIPVSARIMAVADVFDALCSERSYKKAFSIDEAYEILKENRGSHFEPVLVDVMINIRSDLEKIYGKKNG